MYSEKNDKFAFKFSTSNISNNLNKKYNKNTIEQINSEQIDKNAKNIVKKSENLIKNSSHISVGSNIVQTKNNISIVKNIHQNP